MSDSESEPETESFPGKIREVTTTVQFEIDYPKSTFLDYQFSVYSPNFNAGGYQWCLAYYPLGCVPRDRNHLPSHASLDLRLESEDAKEITVEYTFRILNKKKTFITIGNPKTYTFIGYWDVSGEDEFLARDTIERLYCMNGVLVISCSMRFPVSPSSSIEPIVAQANPGGLSGHTEKLLEKGERFDVTFEVEGQRIPAHRFMLAARSPVFETQLYGPMAEAKMKHIKINEMKPDVFRALLYFVYTDKLPTVGSNKHISLSVDQLQGLLVAADRYGIDELIQLCEEELDMNLSVDTVVTTLLLADRHNRTDLKKECLDFASRPKNFLKVALTEAYLNMMRSAPPALLAELSEKVEFNSRYCVKKRRIGW